MFFCEKHFKPQKIVWEKMIKCKINQNEFKQDVIQRQIHKKMEGEGEKIKTRDERETSKERKTEREMCR